MHSVLNNVAKLRVINDRLLTWLWLHPDNIGSTHDKVFDKAVQIVDQILFLDGIETCNAGF